MIIHKIMAITVISFLMIGISGCAEIEEGSDNNNDILIRNVSEFDLYIMIDSEERGYLNNDAVTRTMWDNIPDGIHTIQAFYNTDYTQLHCEVVTDMLTGGEDFYWYLKEDFRFSGSKDGHCR